MQAANDDDTRLADDFDEGEMTFSGGVAAYAMLVVLALIGYGLYRYFRWLAGV